MLYTLEQGPVERQIIQQLYAKGLPPKLPKAIEEAPALTLGLELFFEAFCNLHTCRGGMGDGPIPWLAVDDYCVRIGIDDDAAESLHYVIKRMDSEYMDHQDKERKRKRQADGRNKGKKSRGS